MKLFCGTHRVLTPVVQDVNEMYVLECGCIRGADLTTPVPPELYQKLNSQIVELETDEIVLLERCDVCEARGCHANNHSKLEIELKRGNGRTVDKYKRINLSENEKGKFRKYLIEATRNIDSYCRIEDEQFPQDSPGLGTSPEVTRIIQEVEAEIEEEAKEWSN
jgi:hypothetical protein